VGIEELGLIVAPRNSASCGNAYTPIAVHVRVQEDSAEGLERSKGKFEGRSLCM